MVDAEELLNEERKKQVIAPKAATHKGRNHALYDEIKQRELKNKAQTASAVDGSLEGMG